MKRFVLPSLTVFLALAVPDTLAEILLEENFEDHSLENRGFFDINRGQDHSLLSVAGEPEVRPVLGKGCLKIDYPKGSCGGWMHHKLKSVDEFYCRYYRYFPEGWEWPKGYGPHDTLVTAGKFVVPTNTDLSIYLDFWKSAETFVRVATAGQRWGYGGYAQVLRKKGGRANALAYNVDTPEKMTRGVWHCVEFNARMNDAHTENGRLRLWVNGKLVCDIGDLMLRDTDHSAIQFDRWMLGPYFHGGSHKSQCNYIDALVVSTEYVGTLKQKGNQPPQARFTSSRAWGSMTVNFDASKSTDPEGRAIKYAWHFGDGKTGTGKTPSHKYARAGEYTVTLTVTDAKDEMHQLAEQIKIGRGIGSGIGLKAEYFDGVALNGTPAVLIAPQVDYKRKGWNGRFLCSRRGDNNGTDFSCRWTGLLQATKSEEYKLTLDVHEGGRLWFGEKLVIDSWSTSGSNSVSVGRLEAGAKYPIRIEHAKSRVDTKTRRSDHEWRCVFSWESSSTKKEPVPAGQLYLPAGFEAPRGR